MEDLKVGDWVLFSTKNWPPEVLVIRLPLDEDDPSSREDVTGEGLYSGRGRIVRASPEGWVVQEERSNLLVDVDSGERIELMRRYDDSPLTLGELRQFLEEHRDAPDNTPINVTLPLGFTCDEDYPWVMPEDHPEAHAPDEFYTISASHIVFNSLEEMADLAEQDEDAGEGMHPGPQIEIFLHFEEAHDALRGCDDE
jgi:hypothetical protein